MIRILTISIIGFGLAMIVGSLILWFTKKSGTKAFIEECMTIGMTIIRWGGLALVVYSAFIYVIHPEYSFVSRATGPYAAAYWIMMIGITILPHLYWIGKMRRPPFRLLIAIGLLLTSGAFIEEWVIAVTGIHRDYGNSGIVFSFLLKSFIRMLLFIGVVVIIRDLKNKINKTPKPKL
ncbi:MAG: hypothetical protein Aureis2KO_02270 [Aureisphaera sp.]